MNDYQSAFIGIAVSSFAAAIFVTGYFEQPETLAVMTNLLNALFCVFCATVTGDNETVEEDQFSNLDLNNKKV